MLTQILVVVHVDVFTYALHLILTILTVPLMVVDIDVMGCISTCA